MDERRLDAEIEAKRAATFQECESAEDVSSASNDVEKPKGPKKPLPSWLVVLGCLIVIAAAIVAIYGFVCSVMNFGAVRFRVDHGLDPIANPYSFWVVFPLISSALCIAASAALIWYGRRNWGRLGKVWLLLDVLCLFFCLNLCIPYLFDRALLFFIYYILSPLLALFTGSGTPAL